MHITITGNLGSGKSTVCSLLNKKYCFEVYSTGTIQREIARRLNISTLDMNYVMKQDVKYDKMIDSTVTEIAEKNKAKDIVFDSRLAWYFVPNSFKVFLNVDVDIAADRIINDNRGLEEKYICKEEAKRKLRERTAAESERYKELYNIDYLDLNNYNLVIDTSSRSPEETVELIITRAKEYFAAERDDFGGIFLGKYDNAVCRLLEIIEKQTARIEQMKEQGDFLDYAALPKTIIGICGGDGIGPAITAQAERVLRRLLAADIDKGKVELRPIDGLTIERRAAENKAIPEEVLAQLKECHVILKGPTTTPRAGDPWPNVESANVAMRRELDLFANVRPVKVLSEGIDWVFFRENTEGAYAVGGMGINVSEDLALDFTVTTTGGTERIVRMAFDYARKTGRNRVTAVTKANVIKTTDGKFLSIAGDIAREYPEISFDDWYIDIMTAKLVDTKRRGTFQVLVLPNLYGDILTDEAAEFQGGVGTAGSANIGKRYAMFEAIHGSAPRMVAEGRAQYADPCSILRASVMLLEHIGKLEEAKRLERALDCCMFEEKKLVITGRGDGCTCEQFADYVCELL